MYHINVHAYVRHINVHAHVRLINVHAIVRHINVHAHVRHTFVHAHVRHINVDFLEMLSPYRDGNPNPKGNFLQRWQFPIHNGTI